MADNKIWLPKLSNSANPLYLQIVDAMATDIASGRLAIGEKLPPQRQLAWKLNINHSTVTKAFQHAAKQHLIAGEIGRGTYVLGQSTEAELFLLKQKTETSNIDLSTHVPIAFPEDNDLSESLQSLCQNHEGNEALLDYHSAESLANIRLHAAKWLNQFDYTISGKQCVITSTAQNALLISLLSYCNKDDVVLVNELTFPGMKAAAKQLGLKLYGIKMDEQGIIPDELDLAIRTTNAKVLVSDPHWQNPNATSMNKKRLQDFLAVIKKHQILFIEEYVIGAVSGFTPVSACIKSQSILITSFAKAVAPGIRFAVIAGEHSLISELAKESHSTSWHLSPLIAQIACDWIDNGIAKERRKKQYAAIQKRYQLFKSIFPNNKYPYTKTLCSHIWLPTNISSGQSFQKLKALGVTVVPSATFLVGHQDPNYIRISLTAAKSMQQLAIALELIRDSGIIKTN